MKKESYKKEFLDKFDLKLIDRMKASARWSDIEQDLRYMAPWLLEPKNGTLRGMSGFICELAKKHAQCSDKLGHSVIDTSPEPVLSLQDNYPSQTTIVVPDEDGHLMGRVDDSHGNYYHFGLTDTSVFATGIFALPESQQSTRCGIYIDFAGSGEIQRFPEGSPEYDELIRPTIAQIENDIQFFGLNPQQTAQPADEQ